MATRALNSEGAIDAQQKPYLQVGHCYGYLASLLFFES